MMPKGDASYGGACAVGPARNRRKRARADSSNSWSSRTSGPAFKGLLLLPWFLILGIFLYYNTPFCTMQCTYNPILLQIIIIIPDRGKTSLYIYKEVAKQSGSCNFLLVLRSHCCPTSSFTPQTHTFWNKHWHTHTETHIRVHTLTPGQPNGRSRIPYKTQWSVSFLSFVCLLWVTRTLLICMLFS